MFVWTGTAWVSVASEVESLATYATQSYADNTPGMRLVVPTSVAVGSGSGSVGTSGTVTFSSASSVSLNSCFTSAYRNYKIVLNFSSTNDAYLQARLRASGSDNSTSNYGSAFNYQSLTLSNPTGDVNATATQTSWTKVAYHPANNDHSVMLEIFQPQITSKTTGVGFQSRSDAVFIYTGLLHQGSSSFDGITFIPGAGTITGTIQVYGYKN